VASTYHLADLQARDVTSTDWALAYVRFALRDKPNAAGAYPIPSLADEEILAEIAAAGVVDGSDTYYPAHRVAARLLRANPEFVQRFSAAGYSEESRDAGDLARGIIEQGAWVDAAIADATDGRVSFGQIRFRL
jgi:hypothetical protein